MNWKPVRAVTEKEDITEYFQNSKQLDLAHSEGSSCFVADGLFCKRNIHQQKKHRIPYFTRRR
jgi:hypothetical protein